MPFITNRKDGGITLGQRLKELVLQSKEMKFLVAFFYFSGVEELYEALRELKERSNGDNESKKWKLKILVGLDVDEINGKIVEYGASGVISEEEVRRKFEESIRKVYNSEVADNPKMYEQVDFFIDLLREGYLEIRKTKKPNHSKIYLFELNESQAVNELFIVGSSNLTKAGLTQQDEYNVEIRDYGFEDTRKYFDDLWEDSVVIKKDNVDRIIRILREESLFKKVSPFEVWVYLLKMYLDLYTQRDQFHERKVREILDYAGYKPYDYQVEAVLQAVKIIEHHNGVILADVVGLGKTVVASAIAKILGKRGLVISPPHLIGDEDANFGWRKYIKDFKLYDWKVESSGELEKALDFVKKNEDIEIIIVDEAHRFRNERTKSYHLLHEICRGKKVILLTATPFNNKPSDIFALLKLFTVPKNSTIVLDGDLYGRFAKYQEMFDKLLSMKKDYSTKRDKVKKDYKEIFGKSELPRKEEFLEEVNRKSKELAEKIRSIIEPVVIRRNRLDLKYYNDVVDIPKVEDPIECFFELTEEQSQFYDEVINTFKDPENGGKFLGAIYRPIVYYKEHLEKYAEKMELDEDEITKEENFAYYSQRNLYNFMRRLLVKRFESSFKAFEMSLENIIRSHNDAIEYVEKKKEFVLNKDYIRKVLESEGGDTEDENIEEALKKGISYDFSDEKKRKRFIEAIKRDKEVLENIRNKSRILLDRDPKVEVLIREVKKYLKDRKVVIFTEYVDTARYLEERLKEKFGDIVLRGYGDLAGKHVERIYENFDAQYRDQKDEYKILVATDKFSEGFNLNRAGVVINYDIPWNPVRVIQRVGRINRIGKKVYDEIYILNFFPTEKGEDINRQREIAQHKMSMIHEVLGEDAKIFSPAEEPSPSELYRRLKEYREDEKVSILSRVRKDFENIKKTHPNIVKKLSTLPSRIKVAKEGDKNELFVIIKKGDSLFVGYKDYNEEKARVVSFEEIYDKIKAYPEDKGLDLSSDFWRNYESILDKKFEKERIGEQRQVTDVRSMLKTLLKRGADSDQLGDFGVFLDEDSRAFLESLLEDVDMYGTLSKYVMAEIRSWNKLYKDREYRELKERIKELRKELGDDFSLKISRGFNNIKEDIIVAIENRVVGR